MDGTLNVKLLGVVLRWGLGAVFSGINIRCRDLGDVVPMPRDLGIAIVIPRSRDCIPRTKVPMPRSGNTVPVPRSCPGPVISGL